MALRWDDVDPGQKLFRVEETKTRVPLELPVTRQLGEILVRRRSKGQTVPEELRGWVFPSPMSVSGHVEELQAHYETIGRAEPSSRLVNHARPGDVTEGYAADWSVEQLCEPAQRIADRIDDLINGRLSESAQVPIRTT